MTGSIIEVDGGFAANIFLREDFEHDKTNTFSSQSNLTQICYMQKDKRIQDYSYYEIYHK